MLKDNYFKMPEISNSDLTNFEISPAHYKYFKDRPRPDTKATLTGSAFHYLCFEPENLPKYMLVLEEHNRPEPAKDYRNADNKKWKDEQVAAAQKNGLELISSDDFGIAQDMYDAISKDTEAFELLRAGGNQYERVDKWEWGGIKFRRKADIRNEFFMADLKSTDSADPRDFERSIFNWKYDRQGGMYSDGERIITGTDFFNPFYIIAVEKSPPYGVSVHLLTDEVLQYGCDRYRKLASQLDECAKADKWPGYAYKYNKVNNIYLPKYLRNDGD